jgi:hypothetical protein
VFTIFYLYIFYGFIQYHGDVSPDRYYWFSTVFFSNPLSIAVPFKMLLNKTHLDSSLRKHQTLSREPATHKRAWPSDEAPAPFLTLILFTFNILCCTDSILELKIIQFPFSRLLICVIYTQHNINCENLRSQFP